MKLNDYEAKDDFEAKGYKITWRENIRSWRIVHGNKVWFAEEGVLADEDKWDLMQSVMSISDGMTRSSGQ